MEDSFKNIEMGLLQLFEGFPLEFFWGQVITPNFLMANIVFMISPCSPTVYIYIHRNLPAIHKHKNPCWVES